MEGPQDATADPMRIDTREALRGRFKTWEELRDFVRAGGSLPPMYDDDYEGNRTQLVGMDRPATLEEIVRLFDEIESQDEEHDDPTPAPGSGRGDAVRLTTGDVSP